MVSKQADPERWALTRFNLGIAWQNYPSGHRAQNLVNSIACFKGAAQVQEFEVAHHSLLMQCLATVQRNYERTASATTRPIDSIAPAD